MDDIFYVYVLQNDKGRLYIGFTSDLQTRIQTHQENEAGWTRGKGPWKLVYCETFTNRIHPLHREKSLKRGKSNQELRSLVSQNTAVERVLQPKD